MSADGGPGVFGKSCVLLQSATLPTAASSTGRPGSLADGVSGSRPRDADSESQPAAGALDGNLVAAEGHV